MQTDSQLPGAPPGSLDPVVRCPGCGNEIDPYVCHCGDLMKAHDAYCGHTPVPMGCDCGRCKLPENLNVDMTPNDSSSVTRHTERNKCKPQ